MKKILVLGGTGMLGHTLFKHLCLYEDLDVYATVRSIKMLDNYIIYFNNNNIITNVDVFNFDSIKNVFEKTKPDVVINCIGIVRVNADSIHDAIQINSSLPHKIHYLCENNKTRLIHISTDGVFDGKKGMYKEEDGIKISTIYGMTKYLGEIKCRNCLTIRTSIIGHELHPKKGLVEWFLSEENAVKGYRKAIYTGFPTLELSKIIAKYILPDNDLNGIYHVSSDPISKYELLKIVKKTYNKKIEIKASDKYLSDLSLDSSRFRMKTGYKPPSWEKLILDMYNDFINSN